MWRRVIAAGCGAALTVGLLAWFGRPVPLVRVTVPGVRPDSRIDIAQASADGPASRWAFLRDAEHPRGWAFDHRAGRLLGPWPVPAAVRGYVCDTAGRLYAHAGQGTALSGLPLTVWRVEPGTGTFVPHAEVPDRLHITPTVWEGQPAWLTFAGGPLRVEVIDLATGAVRRRLELPGRSGDLIDNGGPFAGYWDVSADGRWLAIGEGWDGLRRTTPPGIEVWDLTTGRLARRISYPLADPDRGGCSNPLFAGDLLRFTSVVREKRADSVVGVWAAQWQVRMPGGACEPDPAVGDPPRDLCEDRWGDRTADRELFLGHVNESDETAAFLVTDGDRRPLHPKRLLPHLSHDIWGDRLRGRLTASGTGVVFWSSRPGGSSADWLRRLLVRYGWPTSDAFGLDWHDWRTGEVRRLVRPSHRDIDFACQPGGIVVCVHDRGAGRATLEVWADPPPGWPGWWAWVLVATVGATACWIAARRASEGRGQPTTRGCLWWLAAPGPRSRVGLRSKGQ